MENESLEMLKVERRRAMAALRRAKGKGDRELTTELAWLVACLGDMVKARKAGGF